MLVPISQINESVDRFNLTQELPESGAAPLKTGPISESGAAGTMAEAEEKIVLKAAKPAKKSPEGKILTAEQNLTERRRMLSSVGQEPVNFAYERAIGKNDSVYSNFCELIMLAKQKVGRIVIKEGSKNTGYATGFMVSERLLLTNWHVFNTAADVAESEVEFVYELDIFGRPTRAVVFELAVDEFFYSFKDLDYCLVAVKPRDINGSAALSDFGYHFLDPALGKLGEEGKELLNIIHHPDGDYKQISIRENRYTKILPQTIWYETDTAQGSSGSPVFNDQWQVVALHHMGVPSKSADGKDYLDKQGRVIPVVDGEVDIAKICWIANEGIRISVLLADVFGKYPQNPFVEGLKKKPAAAVAMPAAAQKEVTPVPSNTGLNADPTPLKQENKTMDNESSNNIQISIPASLMAATGRISVEISNQPVTNIAAPAAFFSKSGGTAAPETLSPPAAELDEVKKTELENSVDYSGCRGYDPNFLGVSLPLPVPKADHLKYVAKLKNTDKSILDYYYFSTIHHAVRRMPMISAINIDGNQALRQDKAERVDVWLRDHRLDFDMQLNDQFYASSGFDKGHLSRREDADYGPTPELAKKFADLTCVYTNACPQVPGLNRSNKSGLWGQLEKIVLEKGVDLEHGQASKISVFNGPVFSDNDRFYKGVQIPMEFWKIIAWFNSAGQLKATAFRLSQEKLVAAMSFEKLGFDSNAAFQEYRCSIASLGAATGLDFSALAKYDTFTGPDPHESFKINSDTELEEFVAGAKNN